MEEQMDVKYYTPEIEEFHVGFEYQAKTFNKGQIVWVDTTWGTERSFGRIVDNIINLEHFINTEQIRVKCLDHKDIESLRWKELFNETKYFNLKHFNLFFFENTNIISIDKFTYVNGGYTSSAQIFRGEIKNKSELIRLMKQLGI